MSGHVTVTVRKRKDRPGIFRVDIHWNGRRIRKNIKGAAAAEALAVKLRELLALADLMGLEGDLAAVLQQAEPQDLNPVATVADYAETWMADNSGPGGWKRSTRQNYRSLLDRHILPVWGELRLDEVTRRGVKDWLQRQTLAPKTVRNLYRALSSLLTAAVNDEHISTNPIRHMGTVLPRVSPERPRPKAWTEPELARILDEARERTLPLYALFLQLARTGQRIGEALATRWQDVDFGESTLRVDHAWVRGKITSTKGRRYRTVVLTHRIAIAHPPLPDVLRRLRALRREAALAKGKSEPPAYLYCNAKEDQPIDPDNLRKRHWKDIAAGAEVPDYGFHGFRHTFATFMLERGVPIFRVSRILGHSSTSTTSDIYGHALPEDLRPEGDEASHDERA